MVCQDGVVVAADSRTTLANHCMLRVGSDFTHKVFESGGVAVATYGEAFVSDRSIAGHMDEFAVVEAGNRRTPAPRPVLADFFGDRHDAYVAEVDHPDELPPPGVAALGFLIGGYDDAGVGEAWEVTLPERGVEQIATTTNGAAPPGGASPTSSRYRARLRPSSCSNGWRPPTSRSSSSRSSRPCSTRSYRIPFDSMNLQDGIDFAVLCIRTTIDVQRLTLGPVATALEFSWPGVGGPIEIATPSPPPGGSAGVQRTSVQASGPGHGRGPEPTL